MSNGFLILRCLLCITMIQGILYAVAMPSMADPSDNIKYQQAPEPLDMILKTPFLPALSISPDHTYFVLLEQQTLPDIAELAEKELRLAGLRINPDNYSSSRNWFYTSISLGKTPESKTERASGLPKRARISNIKWSPDATHLAFTHTSDHEVELWVLSLKSNQARRLGDFPLNKTYGEPFVWSPDSQSLICKSLSGEVYLPPQEQLPQGPIIMESSDQSTPGRTYQDMLKTPEDEQRFQHYLHGQLVHIDLDGNARNLGESGLIIDFQPAPGGDYILVKQFHKPFSYMFPASRFPLLVEIWNREGKVIKTVADLPLANNIPISFDAVREGKRRIDWRSDAPASLYWSEALDQGNPRQETLWRERLYLWAAPFTEPPRILLDLKQRFNGVYWKNDHFALVYSDWQQSKQHSIWLIEPGTHAPPRLLKSYSSEDQYAHPGHPLLQNTSQGTSVLLTQKDQQTLLLRGQGSSPDGDQPFLDAWNPFTGTTHRLWLSQGSYFERVVHVLDPDELKILLRREDRETPPNYLLKNVSDGQEMPLTDFKHPLPEFTKVHKEVIEYQRKDGVALNATLYLPPGYKKTDGPLPTVFWAYPREFKSSTAAGQIKGSPNAYVRISVWSPLVFLTQGYAVVDQPAMPIIGEGNLEPNDTYIEQLVDSAQAVVDKVVSMGVSDPQRLAIGGHSYGAFMAVNLLAHTNLFQAGIARSGAYNRTLTPFGFQAEQRNLWEATDAYLKMSPLMYAQNIKEPLLLIHGEEDNNSGTHPMQSRNLYQALKGLGSPVRLVLLPYESHSYRAQESLGHTLWEMVRWLDIYLKDRTIDSGKKL